MYLFLLIAPFTYIAFMSLKEYGFKDTRKNFKGLGALRLLAFFLFIFLVYKYFNEGESWFCGSCFGKGKYNPFALPSAGAGLLMFPAVLANSIDYSLLSKAKETTMSFTGFVLIVLGVSSII